MTTWIASAVVAMGLYAVAPALGIPSVAVKPIPVALLALGVARGGDRPGARWLAAAMAVDSLADGVIEVSFLGGLAVFLVAHLLRIRAFVRDAPGLHLWAAVPFALVAAAGLGSVVPGAGPLAVPIVIYGIVLAAMGWRAAARLDGSWSARLGVVGAALYLASDTLIAVDRFAQPVANAHTWIMSTYWAAQILLARSAGGSGPRVR